MQRRQEYNTAWIRISGDMYVRFPIKLLFRSCLLMVNKSVFKHKSYVQWHGDLHQILSPYDITWGIYLPRADGDLFVTNYAEKSNIFQKDGFLAGSMGIEVSSKMQNLMQGMFSGEGFFTLKVSGRGTIFLNSYGGIHAINLAAGEERIVDNSHLVAWPDYMEYKIEKASSGWISSFTSGEMLVCRFKGPGVVLIQTRNPQGFADWIKGLLPPK